MIKNAYIEWLEGGGGRGTSVFSENSVIFVHPEQHSGRAIVQGVP